MLVQWLPTLSHPYHGNPNLCSCSPQPMMTSSCPKAIISLSYLCYVAIGLPFFLGGKRRIGMFFLRCCWRLNEHYTTQAHYNHDIALVDQGGTRSTF